MGIVAGVAEPVLILKVASLALTARSFHAFRIAIETDMRAADIVGLEWERLDLVRRVARLTHTRNGRSREVPLSSEVARHFLHLLDSAMCTVGFSKCNIQNR